MREHEREAFLEANIPMLPRDGEEVKNRTLRKREELVRDIRWNDHGKDLTLTDLESMKWNFKLWQGPISKCFPEVDLRQGSRGKNRLGLRETRRCLAGAELGEFGYGISARQRLGR